MNRFEVFHTFNHGNIANLQSFPEPLSIYQRMITPPIFSTTVVIPHKIRHSNVNFVPIQERGWATRREQHNIPHYLPHQLQRKDIRSEEKISNIMRKREEQKRRELQIKSKKIEDENQNLKNKNRLLEQRMQQVTHLLKMAQQRKQKENLDTEADSVVLDERRLKRARSANALKFKLGSKLRIQDVLSYQQQEQLINEPQCKHKEMLIYQNMKHAMSSAVINVFQRQWMSEKAGGNK